MAVKLVRLATFPMNSLVDSGGAGIAADTTRTNTNGRQLGVTFEHKKLCRVSHGPRVVLGPTISCSTPSPTGTTTAVSLITARNDFVPVSTAPFATSNDSQPPLLSPLALGGAPDYNNGLGGGGGNGRQQFYNRQQPRKRLETVDSSGSYYCSSGSDDRDFRQCSIGDEICADNLSIVESEDSSSCCSSQKNFALTSPSSSSTECPPHGDEPSSVGSELSKLRLQDSGYCSSSLPLDGVYDYSSNEYANLLDFALKLGYNEFQLRTVLQRFPVGTYVGQDKVLAELIKLGQDVQQDAVVVVGPRSSPLSCPTGGLNGHKEGKSLVGSPSANQQSVQNEVGLRAVVIDGSNVAVTHGHKEIFSCKGIKECVDWFKARGHTDIKVFVPQFRKEASRSDSPITDQHILFELEQEGILIWTPSRRLGGRRIVCHDDKYIVRTAADKDAIIVSNDEYRDIMKENPEFKKVIEERLLMYSFVDGKFMPPDDPLGRYGPKLDQFLRKGFSHTVATLCPYGRKCTYGNKCKFSHPERPGGLHRSVTDRLKDHADLHRRISPSNSLQPSNATNKSELTAQNSLTSHSAACRSQSLTQAALMRHHSPSPLCQSPPKPNFAAPNCSTHQQQQQMIRKNNCHVISDTNNLTNRENLSKQLSNPENRGGGVSPLDPVHGQQLTNQNQEGQNQGGQNQNGRKLLRAAASFTVGNEDFFIPPCLQNIWQMSHQPISRNLSAPGQQNLSKEGAGGFSGPAPSAHPPYGDFSHVEKFLQRNNINSSACGNNFYYPVSSFPPTSATVAGATAIAITEQQHRKNSISDTQLNLLGQQHSQLISQQQQQFLANGMYRTVGLGAAGTESGDVFAPNQAPPACSVGSLSANWYLPSTTVWGPLENSSVPIFTCSSWHSPPAAHSQLATHSQMAAHPHLAASHSYAAPSNNSQSPTSRQNLVTCRSNNLANSQISSNLAANHQISNEKREQLFYHLSKLFSADVVASVMNANLNENDPQRLCQLILLENAKRASAARSDN